MTTAQTAKQTNRRRAMETIAVLGAGGTMGFPIARNIIRAGLPTRVWNRSSEKARPLTADGAYLARTPEDAASGAGIVITMLADEEAVIRAMDAPRAPSGRCAAPISPVPVSPVVASPVVMTTAAVSTPLVTRGGRTTPSGSR